MSDDIVPELLDKINADFDRKTADSKVLKEALQLLKNKKADFLNANAFGIEAGEILSDVLSANITPDILPDGRMYYNIADRVLNSTLQKNFDLVSGYAVDVQSELNSLANIGIKAQVPELNKDRINGLVNRLASESSFEDIQWLLKEPIINFSQSVVDDTIEKNIEFQSRAGLNPKITRKAVGRACKWCQALAGSYDYPSEVPHDVYRRHENCRCTVEYHPGDGKRQDVWSKKEFEYAQKRSAVEARKQVGLPVNYKEVGEFELDDSSHKWYNEVLTEKEREAIWDYTNPNQYYEEINNALRNSDYSKNTRALNTAKIVSDSLSKYNLEDDIIAYRGMKIEELEQFRKTGINKAFTSVSINKKIADDDFDGARPGFLTAEVHIPKGTAGAYIDGHGAVGVESEFLLDKGTKFKIIQRKDKTILEVINE